MPSVKVYCLLSYAEFLVIKEVNSQLSTASSVSPIKTIRIPCPDFLLHRPDTSTLPPQILDDFNSEIGHQRDNKQIKHSLGMETFKILLTSIFPPNTAPNSNKPKPPQLSKSTNIIMSSTVENVQRVDSRGKSSPESRKNPRESQYWDNLVLTQVEIQKLNKQVELSQGKKLIFSDSSTKKEQTKVKCQTRYSTEGGGLHNNKKGFASNHQQHKKVSRSITNSMITSIKTYSDPPNTHKTNQMLGCQYIKPSQIRSSLGWGGDKQNRNTNTTARWKTHKFSIGDHYRQRMKAQLPATRADQRKP